MLAIKLKNKFGTSIRWKIIFYFALSIGLSILSINFLLSAAYLLYSTLSFKYIFKNLINIVGMQPFIIISGVLLFILYFFLLTQKLFRYIEEISTTLQKAAHENFDIKIPVRSADELGDLAENINQMTLRLKDLIEIERNSEKLRTELVTSMSHDLRTPLTSVLGYLGLIVNCQYKDEKGLKHCAEIAFNKAQKLQKLIDELFEFTLLSYGSIKINSTAINLNELLEQLVEEFFPVFQYSNIECRLSLCKSRIIVAADGDMLARVFDNLIANAIRYSHDSKYMDVELTKDNFTAVAAITNYGAPIPPDSLPHVFEKFYRVEQSRSEATGGAGLGLAIAKNIIDLHNGSISVSSDKNKTTFEVTLKLMENPN